MNELILTTYDWVPEAPRGYVRDLRVRWALEEAGLPYRVASTPFRDRSAGHLAHQPFGQVPWLTDGDLSIFESGAILLHLGERSEALLPRDPRGRSETLEWVFAALNSVEPHVQHLAAVQGDDPVNRQVVDLGGIGNLENLGVEVGERLRAGLEARTEGREQGGEDQE